MTGIQKIPKEDILAAIEKLGPCQPIDIRKHLHQGDSFLIGALLSELVHEGKVAISNTRRGGSPFYYDVQRPETLENVAQYLNEKDRRTCALLKEKSVLREDAVEPLVRVGLRSIEDFSRSFTVGEPPVTYWRYFLVTEDQARVLAARAHPDTAAGEPEPADTKSDSPVEKTTEPQQSATTQAASDPTTIEANAPAPLKEEISVKEPTPQAVKKKRAIRKKPPAVAGPTSDDWLEHDTLYEKVRTYAVTKKAVIGEQRSVRPNLELTCTFTTPTILGTIVVSVLAVNRKKIVEKDVTQALLAARAAGTPLLFLSVEGVPAKLQKTFSDVPNVFLDTL